MTANGEAAVNDTLTADRQAPPWADVDPWVLVRSLEAQLAAANTEMTMMRAYIGQLHQALQATAGAGITVPAEERP